MQSQSLYAMWVVSQINETILEAENFGTWYVSESVGRSNINNSIKQAVFASNQFPVFNNPLEDRNYKKLTRPLRDEDLWCGPY